MRKYIRVIDVSTHRELFNVCCGNRSLTKLTVHSYLRLMWVLFVDTVKLGYRNLPLEYPRRSGNPKVRAKRWFFTLRKKNLQASEGRGIRKCEVPEVEVSEFYCTENFRSHCLYSILSVKQKWMTKEVFFDFKAMAQVQESVSIACTNYFLKFRRSAHVTPKSFLSFINRYENKSTWMYETCVFSCLTTCSIDPRIPFAFGTSEIVVSFQLPTC